MIKVCCVLYLCADWLQASRACAARSSSKTPTTDPPDVTEQSAAPDGENLPASSVKESSHKSSETEAPRCTEVEGNDTEKTVEAEAAGQDATDVEMKETPDENTADDSKGDEMAAEVKETENSAERSQETNVDQDTSDGKEVTDDVATTEGAEVIEVISGGSEINEVKVADGEESSKPAQQGVSEATVAPETERRRAKNWLQSKRGLEVRKTPVSPWIVGRVVVHQSKTYSSELCLKDREIRLLGPSDCAKSLQGEAPCGGAVNGKVDEMSPAPSPSPALSTASCCFLEDVCKVPPFCLPVPNIFVSVHHNVNTALDSFACIFTRSLVYRCTSSAARVCTTWSWVRRCEAPAGNRSSSRRLSTDSKPSSSPPTSSPSVRLGRGGLQPIQGPSGSRGVLVEACCRVQDLGEGPDLLLAVDSQRTGCGSFQHNQKKIWCSGCP